MRRHRHRSRSGSEARLDAFVASLQLSDSVFPSGLYALSYGIESLAQAGLLRDGTLEPFVAEYLRMGVGPADGVALACAHRGAAAGSLDEAAAADARLAAVKLPREAREASARVGRQLLATALDVLAADEGRLVAAYLERARAGRVPGSHAVALGLVSAALGIRRARAVAGELYSFAASAVSAAVRLGVSDHREAQRILRGVTPVIAEVARRSARGRVGDIASSTPLVDVMAMRHEEAELRMFMT